MRSWSHSLVCSVNTFNIAWWKNKTYFYSCDTYFNRHAITLLEMQLNEYLLLLSVYFVIKCHGRRTYLQISRISLYEQTWTSCWMNLFKMDSPSASIHKYFQKYNSHKLFLKNWTDLSLRPSIHLFILWLEKNCINSSVYGTGCNEVPTW